MLALARKLRSAALAVILLSAPASVSRAALSFFVDPRSPWPSGWYNGAVSDMQTVVNMYNAYGDFGNGSIYVYYNAGIPTAQSGYGGYGGSIGIGGTYPNVRVLLHESSHWLGTGTFSHNWAGPASSALIQQFDGVGAVLNGDNQHYWPYGENYDSESSPINDARHVAMVYALRKDFGIGSTAPPSSATNVTLRASDAVGTSGFNYPWGWSDSHFVQPGTNYSTGPFDLRTPNGYPSWRFAGNSLTVNSGGRLLYNGWGTTGVVTVNNLILNGGTVQHDQNPIDLFQLAGKVTLISNNTVNADNGNISITAPIGGSGSLTKTGNYTLTLGAGCSYAGPTVVNAGTLRLIAAAPVASYSFANVSGSTVFNDGTGGAGMNGTLNANGGTGRINTSGGPVAGLGALVLNGTGTTVDINSGVTDLSGDGSWTVSAWIKTTQPGATIFNKGDGTNWSSGFSTFYLGDGNNAGAGGLPDAVRWGGGWVAGSRPVNNGSWHQVTYTNAGGTKSIYLDGIPSSLSQNQFFNADTGSKIRIGFAPDPGDGAATTSGLLSGIKFYNVALSAAQAAQLFNGAGFSVLPATTDVSIAPGATLDVNGVHQTIGSLSGPAGSAMKLGSGGQLEVSSSANTTFAGNISGTGSASLTKSGAGVLTLGGVNTYTGGTTVNAGTLSVSTDANLGAATGPLNINASGTVLLTAPLSSSRPIVVGSAGATIDVTPAAGALILTGSINGAGTLNLTEAGNLSVPASGRLTVGGTTELNATGTISIANGATVVLQRGATPLTGRANNLTLAGDGTLDLGNHELLLSAPTPAAIRADLVSGYNGGAWNGAGIVTSLADSTHGLGYADSGSGDLLVKCTVYGDANLDGKVDFSDLVNLARNYGQKNAAWNQGDFNYDGAVGFDDLVLLARDYGQSLTASQLATLDPAFRADVEQAFWHVPEPSSLALFAIAGALLRRRRRRTSLAESNDWRG